MTPRGASTRIARSWLFCATRRYWWPERICSAQSRRNSAPKTSSTNPPRTATRSAACGVSRYGSSTRGSGGRNVLLAKQAHLSGALAPVERRQQLRDDPVHRSGEDEIERDRGDERLE